MPLTASTCTLNRGPDCSREFPCVALGRLCFLLLSIVILVVLWIGRVRPVQTLQPMCWHHVALSPDWASDALSKHALAPRRQAQQLK